MEKENQTDNIQLEKKNVSIDENEKICDNKEENNINSGDLNDLLNNFNSENNDISQIFNNFSKGDLGDAIKQFTNVISNNSKKMNTPDKNVCETEEELDEDSDEEDFTFDLDKYFISKDGQNICDVLSDIKSELTNIKFKL